MTSAHKYKLLEKQYRRDKLIGSFKICLLTVLCLVSVVATGLTWLVLHRQTLRYPGESLNRLPNDLLQSKIASHETLLRGHYDALLADHRRQQQQPTKAQLLQNEEHAKDAEEYSRKLVCYYNFPKEIQQRGDTVAAVADVLLPKDIDPQLCTHLNVGFIPIVNNSLELATNQKLYLSTQIQDLRRKNPNLKVLFWVGGGAFDYGFTDMVQNHKTRKQFIQSVKENLQKFSIDGVDLDWEFPSPYNKDRQHFSQLLYEIRREFQREKRPYLLTIAMPAPAQYQDALYDIRMVNENVDFVNVMAYDYNLYSTSTPFTGLNAPLFPAADVDQGIFSYLNINYTAYNLQSHGLDKRKIVIGLPTYGHSFRLVSPFNHHIHSPASGNGRLGMLGFITYSQVCWFMLNNFYVNSVYDEPSCSPYLYSVFEWVSYENDQSIECKSRWIKDNQFGGAMIFSLNSDDFNLYCLSEEQRAAAAAAAGGGVGGSDDFKFPLTRKVRQILNP